MKKEKENKWDACAVCGHGRWKHGRSGCGACLQAHPLKFAVHQFTTKAGNKAV